MITISTMMWRLVLLGFLAAVVAFWKVDVATAQEIGKFTGIGMFGATVATLWDF